MAAPVTCTQCGARNPAEAEWCGQCFAPLEEKQAGEDGPRNGEKPAASPAAVAEEGSTSLEASVGHAEDAPTTKPGTWVCSVCDTSNLLEVEDCSACGTSIFRAFGAEVQDAVDVDPRQALLRSVMFPGLGHAYAQQGLLGAAIGGFTLMAVGFGIGLAATGLGNFGWPLLLEALGVWVAAAFDAYRIAGGQETDTLLLKPRVITALVGSVMLIVVLAAMLRGDV